jgi:ankyrin repeat protein
MSGVDPEGRLLLHYAALENRVRDAKERLAAGDNPNLGDRQGFTPLHLAAQEWSVDVARLLLDHGAEVDRQNMFGNTPLFVSVFNSKGRGDLIELLRKRGADPFKANQAGQTPVDLARLIGNYDVAQFFADLPV